MSAISEGVMHMDETMAFLLLGEGGGAALAAVHEQLAQAGLSITREDALMLAERRAEVQRLQDMKNRTADQEIRMKNLQRNHRGA